MKLRSIARFVLIVYTFAAFGALLDVGYSHDEATILAQANGASEHVHSKHQHSIHTFVHSASLSDKLFLSLPCCCCVCPGHEDSELPAHALTSHGRWSDFSLLIPAIFSLAIELEAEDPEIFFPLQFLQPAPTLVSITTVMLLI